eukprot:jgi/Tetstr1/442244/TSEL_030385.t1
MAASSDDIRVVVEGCCHGELDKIYATMAEMEAAQGIKIDMLICFGGNHEVANYMWELYHGGWVAPNIYFLGYAGVVNFGGLRIGGISGISNDHHYRLGHFEAPPYNPKTVKSAYHIRELEVLRLQQLRRPLDVFLSHEWPRGVYNFGNKAELLRKKPFFRREVEQNELGSAVVEGLMSRLQPAYWFAAHLHVKHAALVQHPPAPGGQVGNVTKFLALDKCLPGRDFLQMVTFPGAKQGKQPVLRYDAEWLAILRSTHDMLSTTHRAKPLNSMRAPTQAEIDAAQQLLDERGEAIPENFAPTAPAAQSGGAVRRGRNPTQELVNPQSVQFLSMLGLRFNLSVHSQAPGGPLPPPPSAAVMSANPEEIELGDDDVVSSDDEPGGQAAVGNPEEIDIGEEEEEEEEGEEGAAGGRSLFEAVEIHGSSIADRHDL